MQNTSKNSDENTLESIISNEFSFQEACSLVNLHVIPIEAENLPPSIEHIGFVAGVLCFNAEVEVVVKFIDGLKQYTKEEFETLLMVLDDESPGQGQGGTQQSE